MSVVPLRRAARWGLRGEMLASVCQIRRGASAAPESVAAPLACGPIRVPAPAAPPTARLGGGNLIDSVNSGSRLHAPETKPKRKARPNHGFGRLPILPGWDAQEDQVLPCAKDLLADLNKIVDALKGGQRAGAMSLLNRQLELKGSRACLLALKGMTQLQMQDFEGVAKTAEEFLQAHPDNPVACGVVRDRGRGEG